jgi:hypothetical protein
MAEMLRSESYRLGTSFHQKIRRNYKEKREVRGGGESGSMKRRKSRGFANSIGDWMNTTVAAASAGGSTKAIEVSKDRSESGQQDIAQAIIPDMSCPQSM